MDYIVFIVIISVYMKTKDATGHDEDISIMARIAAVQVGKTGTRIDRRTH